MNVSTWVTMLLFTNSLFSILQHPKLGHLVLVSEWRIIRMCKITYFKRTSGRPLVGEKLGVFFLSKLLKLSRFGEKNAKYCIEVNKNRRWGGFRKKSEVFYAFPLR